MTKPKTTTPKRGIRWKVPDTLAAEIRKAGGFVDKRELEERLKTKAFAAISGDAVGETAREMFDDAFGEGWE